MLRSMSIPELNPVSYVVMGLVKRDGPSTPYELKTAVGRGIAYFWQFPHSQIYAESERLARLGLLLEEREQTGRRRRTFRITPEGRAALRAWLAQPTSEPTAPGRPAVPASARFAARRPLVAAAPPATATGLGADQRTTRRKSGRCRYGGATRCGLLRP